MKIDKWLLRLYSFGSIKKWNAHMLKKLPLLSALIIATASHASFELESTFERESSVREPSAQFCVNEQALRTYVMVERYVKGSCPEDVSPEDLLKAVMYLGGKSYDFVREKASQEEVDRLRASLQGAYKQGDTNISVAVQYVVFTQYDFAKERFDVKKLVPHCLDCVWRTIMLFVSHHKDRIPLPGEGIRNSGYEIS